MIPNRMYLLLDAIYLQWDFPSTQKVGGNFYLVVVTIVCPNLVIVKLRPTETNVHFFCSEIWSGLRP